MIGRDRSLAGNDRGGTTMLVALLGATVLAGTALALAATDTTTLPGTDDASTDQAPLEAADERAPEQQTTGEEVSPASGEPEAVEITWQGHTGTGACVPAGPNACIEAYPEGVDDRLDTQAAGKLAHVNVSMSWDAVLPSSEMLRLTLVTGYEEVCGLQRTCFHWTWQGHTVGNMQPLTINVSDLDVPEDESLWLLVDLVDAKYETFPQPLHHDVSHEQAFRVDAAITPATPATEGA